MAVAFDAAVARNLNSVSSDSWSHTCTGADRYVVVAVGVTKIAGTTATVTYDGVSMTSLGEATNTTFQSAAHGMAKLFGLVNPPTGAKTVVLTFSAGSNAGGASSVSYTGVHQSVSAGTPGTDTPNSSTSSAVTITDGVASDMILSAIAVDTGASALTCGDTQRMNELASGYMGGSSDAPGAASVVMDWSWTTSSNAAHVAVALKQATSGGGSTLMGQACV